MTKANTNDLIVDVFIKAAIIEEDECNSSWCCAADEEHHDGDGDQHQRPLLLVLHQQCLSLRPEVKLLGKLPKCKQLKRQLLNLSSANCTFTLCGVFGVLQLQGPPDHGKSSET